GRALEVDRALARRERDAQAAVDDRRGVARGEARLPLGDRRVERAQVELLVGRDLVAVGRELAGEREDRRAVEVAVRDPGDQVRRARAERREADARDAGARGRGLGDEAGARLVPREDELEPGLSKALDEVHDLAAGVA